MSAAIKIHENENEPEQETQNKRSNVFIRMNNLYQVDFGNHHPNDMEIDYVDAVMEEILTQLPEGSPLDLSIKRIGHRFSGGIQFTDQHERHVETRIRRDTLLELLNGLEQRFRALAGPLGMADP